jgi:hypothetical protein
MTVMALTATLCGCAAIERARQEGQQRDVESARQSCATIGFTDGTPLFAHCVEAELSRMADRRQRAIEQLEQQARPTYLQPSAPSRRFCLPTAAGAGGPNYACF